jgi:hypothetical protein
MQRWLFVGKALLLQQKDEGSSLPRLYLLGWSVSL